MTAKSVVNQLEAMRHSCEHVLTQAMLRLYPDIKMAMGPPIETGFYFDFDPGKHKISEADFPKIEKEMAKIVKENLPLKKEVVSVKKAKELFKGNEYKQEWLDEIEQEGEEANLYRTGKDFVDLCAGPHVTSTGKIGAFKLLSIAGAYWRGNEKNKMLTRVYGTCFATPKKLRQHLSQLEEAKKRDHRKLGKELDLFCFSDLVGPGLPLFTPKGTIIKEELQKFIEKICYEYGYGKVMTPHLAKIKLFEKSGHAEKFSQELFHVSSGREHEFVMRPVLCPHQTQIYASKPRSYKDLPIRYMESEKQYRAEKSGEVGGLNRVYAITIEDGHSFCTVNQVKDEIKTMIKIIERFYSALGLWGNHWVSLSVRDYEHPEKYIGKPKDWDQCEAILEEVNQEMKLKAQRREGEAALYGPKLDFMFKDSLGNDVQIPTVQIDFATPKRFDLFYIDQKGEKVSPVMVHRAVLGSYERMIALLIEHFNGAFPVWISPVQVAIIPITDKHLAYCQKLQEKLKNKNIRTQLNDRAETTSAKIRNAELQKVPYMLIVGDREVEGKKVNVRTRGKKVLGDMALEKFTKLIRQNIEQKIS
ncbi:threonine--tRNA ligase [Patescibacteria group bacterium]